MNGGGIGTIVIHKTENVHMSKDKRMTVCGVITSPVVSQKIHNKEMISVTESGSVYITNFPTMYNKTAVELGWLK